jgi:hypothetical protein
MTVHEQSAGDVIPPHSEIIEVRVTDPSRLFKSIDPSPFRERDLDADAEAFIVAWAKQLPRDAQLALLVHVLADEALHASANVVRDAVRTFFGGLIRESLMIGGWVAMWRPLEVFLYDWWPIVAEARLYDRLAAMPVRLELAAAMGASPSVVR